MNYFSINSIVYNIRANNNKRYVYDDIVEPKKIKFN